MRKFCEDYWKLVKENGSFLKKHWLGYIILCIAVTVISIAAFFVHWKEVFNKVCEAFKNLINKVKSLFKKETKES